MRTTKKSAPAATMTLEPEPVSPVDPRAEMDFWHVNYMTRPYYKQGRSFGDYEAAYRYGLENAITRGEMTFEGAEKAHLAAGWPAARGSSALPWEEVREAALDAWNRARRNRKVSS